MRRYCAARENVLDGALESELYIRRALPSLLTGAFQVAWTGVPSALGLELQWRGAWDWHHPSLHDLDSCDANPTIRPTFLVIVPSAFELPATASRRLLACRRSWRNIKRCIHSCLHQSV